MKKKPDNKKELDSYLESVKARQRNLTWPDVLRGSRSVDEYLWEGARDAPLIQRIGAVIVGLTYILIGLAFTGMALEQGEWFIGVAVPVIFGLGVWFIRNALLRKNTGHS